MSAHYVSAQYVNKEKKEKKECIIELSKNNLKLRNKKRKPRTFLVPGQILFKNAIFFFYYEQKIMVPYVLGKDS